MKDQSVEANIANIDKDFINNYKDKQLSLNNSNITGLQWESHFIKKEKEINKNNLGQSDLDSSNEKNNTAKSSIYQTLSKKEKIKFIQNLVKNSMEKEPFDFLAVKRKTYSLGYLIRQFDIAEKSKSFEENNICKIPYPLLYCISNRKVGNNSSNLLAKILTSENKNLSKNQEIFIKKSVYTKIFNSNLSDLIRTKFRNRSSLKTNSNLSSSNLSNLSNISKQGKFPFLNKYIKSKVENYNYSIIDKNKINNFPTSIGFFSKQKHKKLNLKTNMKKWNSTFCVNVDRRGNDNNKKYKNKQFKNNNIENFKNRTVCLNNHKSNIINSSFINEKNNKIIEDIYYRKRKNRSEQRLIEIIKDVSHLKFNNQIMPFFNRKISEKIL